MAHRSKEPGRLQRAKLTVPRDRGEKYAAPDKATDDEPDGLPPGTRRKGRRGQAHALLLKLKPGSLPTRGRPV